MVRILFTGDTHLDVNYPATIARSRNNEFQDIFDQIIELAIKENVQIVCHLGDMFNNSAPAPVEVRLVIEKLARLGEHGIQFYCIRGNHEGSADLEGVFKGWAGEYVSAASMDHVHLIDPVFDKARHISTYGYRDLPGSIRIYGIGYFFNETGQKLKETVDIETLDQDKYNIVLLHAYIKDFNDTKRERSGEAPIAINDITGLNVDLVAVGHSHDRVDPKKIENTTFFCPGSPVDWMFRHTGSHGVYVANIDPDSKTAAFEWKDIETTYSMEELTIDGGDAPHPKEWFENQLAAKLADTRQETTKPLILSIVFKGHYSQGSPRLDANAVRSFLQETLGKDLFFLGNVSTKGVNYEGKKVADIQDIRDMKMDEDRILDFLISRSVEKEFAEQFVSFYKEVDLAYTNPDNLTPKKKELKEGVSSKFAATMTTQIRDFYAGLVTDKELDAITFEVAPAKRAPAKAGGAKKAGRPAKARASKKGGTAVAAPPPAQAGQPSLAPASQPAPASRPARKGRQSKLT
jgi:DNA repair exonuclease SbcCD nuclease subunit